MNFKYSLEHVYKSDQTAICFLTFYFALKLSTSIQTADFRLQKADFRFHIAKSRFQKVDFRFQISDFRFQKADFKFQILERFQNLYNYYNIRIINDIINNNII